MLCSIPAGSPSDRRSEGIYGDKKPRSNSGMIIVYGFECWAGEGRGTAWLAAFALKRRRDYVSRVSAGLGARAAPRNIWAAAAAASQRMDRHERTNSGFALPKSCVNRPFTSQSPKRREKQRRFNVPNRDARSLASAQAVKGTVLVRFEQKRVQLMPIFIPIPKHICPF